MPMLGRAGTHRTVVRPILQDSVLVIVTITVLCGLPTSVADSTAYPSIMDGLRDNDSAKPAYSWDSVDLKEALDKAGQSDGERPKDLAGSDLNNLLHWAIGVRIDFHRAHLHCYCPKGCAGKSCVA